MRPAGGAEPAHAVRHAGWKRGQTLGVLEALAHLAEHGVRADHALLEDDFAVTAGERVVEASDPSHHPHAGVGGLDQEHRRPTADLASPCPVPGTSCPVSAIPGHADEERRPGSTRDEPLPAVDHPRVAVGPSRGEQGRGVAAGPGGGLRHGEGRPGLAPDQRSQEPLPLLGRGHHLEEVHVALVGGGAVEGEGTEGAVAGRLENGRAPAQIESETSPGGASGRREQAPLPGLGLGSRGGGPRRGRGRRGPRARVAAPHRRRSRPPGPGCRPPRSEGRSRWSRLPIHRLAARTAPASGGRPRS